MSKRLGKRKQLEKLESYDIDNKVIEKYKTKINKIDNSIDLVNKQIGLLKKKFKKLREKKIQAGRDILPTGIIWELYYKAGVDVSRICETFGIKKSSELRGMIDGCKLTGNCSICAAKIEWHPTSKSNLNDILKRGNTLCQSCSERKTQEHREERQEQQLQLGIRLQELKQMDYREYLMTQEWGKTRKKALNRAGYRCQLCNNVENLNVHHKTYERRGEEHNDDLIVLCRGCHARHHEIKERN